MSFAAANAGGSARSAPLGAVSGATPLLELVRIDPRVAAAWGVDGDGKVLSSLHRRDIGKDLTAYDGDLKVGAVLGEKLVRGLLFPLGYALLLVAAGLTLWSMVHYLRAAWPHLREGSEIK